MSRTHPFYDQLAAALLASEGVALRIHPEGHRVNSIREMLRERGLIVTISARQDERPWIEVRLLDQFDPKTPTPDPRAGIPAPTPWPTVPVAVPSVEPDPNAAFRALMDRYRTDYQGA